MNKQLEWRVEREAYPASFGVTTCYRDVDVQGHVNNFSLARYFDDTREPLMRRVLEVLPEGETSTIVTAEVTVTYLAEVTHPDIVQVAIGVRHIGTSSFGLAQAMFQRTRCVSLCSSAFVQTLEGKSRPLSRPFRESLLRYWIRQGPSRSQGPL
jgi:acyl-CoA thioester hydrolase